MGIGKDRRDFENWMNKNTNIRYEKRSKYIFGSLIFLLVLVLGIIWFMFRI